MGKWSFRWVRLTEWLSGVLCRIEVHSWEYGPGECCSRCGYPDRFWPDAKPGRPAVHEIHKIRRYYPHGVSQLPPGWRHVDDDSEDGDTEPESD